MDNPAPCTATIIMAAERVLDAIGVPREDYNRGTLFARSPINGARIGKLKEADGSSAEAAIARATAAAAIWRNTLPPHRGELIRRVGERLRQHRSDLAFLTSIETGKMLQEAKSEIDFAIRLCDFAFGISSQFGAAASPPSKPYHRAMELWQPLGVTGCITPFNAPVCRFAQHAFMSIVCGNSVVWKPSERASLTALAIHSLMAQAERDFGAAPTGLVELLLGGPDIGKLVCEDFRISYLSVGASIATGRLINMKLAQRFTRATLMLAGNNAGIVCDSADLELAALAGIYGITTGSGQDFLNQRRLFVHRDVYEPLLARLRHAFKHVPVGNPLERGRVMGPLVDRQTFETMQRVLQEARNDCVRISGGDRLDVDVPHGGYYVRPAIVELPEQTQAMLRSAQVPVLFVVPIESLAHGIALTNESDAGLGAAIFTRSLPEVDHFLGVQGVDTGMAAVNTLSCATDSLVPLAGAKSSAGGRITVTEPWKMHMRRCAATINMGPAPTGPLIDIITEKVLHAAPRSA